MSRLSDALKQLGYRLGEAPTLAYVIAYVVLIVVFAFAYSMLPDRSFYHSTSQYEYEYFNQDANGLLSELRQVIISNYHEARQQSQIDFNGWQGNMEETRLSSLNVLNFPKYVAFTIGLPLTHTLPYGGVVYGNLSAVITINLEEFIGRGNTIYRFITTTQTMMPPLFLSTVPPMPSATDLLQWEDEAGQFSDTTGILPISRDLNNRLIWFGQGVRGFPSHISGQLWRMLYLSAGIATSNALGDITPLTTRARLLVTLEAVLAIILLSLLLNALAHDIVHLFRNDRQPQQPVEIAPPAEPNITSPNRTQMEVTCRPGEGQPLGVQDHTPKTNVPKEFSP